MVLEVGPGVEDLAVGDRVMGLLEGAFGSVAVTDRRFLVRVPEGWSWARAASVPIVYLTAYYGLVDLAGVRNGASGCWCTRRPVVWGSRRCSSPSIWDSRCGARRARASGACWKAWGWTGEHIASSRELEFGERFAEAGVDVVLNSLAGEFVDASLGLLGEGGPLPGDGQDRHPRRRARSRSVSPVSPIGRSI